MREALLAFIGANSGKGTEGGIYFQFGKTGTAALVIDSVQKIVFQRADLMGGNVVYRMLGRFCDRFRRGDGNWFRRRSG